MGSSIACAGRRLVALLLALGAALCGTACAGRHRPATRPAAPSAAAAAPAESSAAPAQTAAGESAAPPAPKRSSLHAICHQGAPDNELMLDETRRRIAETFCGATLWFDGLFGGRPNVVNARSVSGRIELSNIYTEADGMQPRARLHLNYDLPTLKHRVNLFLGRDEGTDFVHDRPEGVAIRSSVFGLETEDRWLAGLGYSPPGRWAERLDFRVGGRLSTAPEAFVQGRLRRNVFIGDRSVWRFRETVFYENRDGLGSTTSADFDRILTRDLLFRWDAVATFSEATKGVDWRTATVVYQNLLNSSAIAYEAFMRGATDSEVGVREYGARAVYRHTLTRQWLYGELIGGYTWPREKRDQPRAGSALVGVGVELLFGRQPF